jgi:molybdopterin-guanine dinucleotide biosynthesis protein A
MAGVPDRPAEAPAERLGAVVLTGGSGSRMGGVDKASIELDGVTLLERSLAATVTAVEVVVVGDQVPTTRPVTWTREDPRGGGPAAGLLAGIDRFLRPPDLLAVLAVDMPRVGPGTFARLVEALTPSYDGALLVDGDGRRQPLCAVYRRRALEAARPADQEEEHGLAVRALIGPLSLVEVPAVDAEADDVDTWSDLRALRESRHG